MSIKHTKHFSLVSKGFLDADKVFSTFNTAENAPFSAVYVCCFSFCSKSKVSADINAIDISRIVKHEPSKFSATNT